MKPSQRRWKRLFFRILVVVVCLLIGLAVIRWQISRIGDQKLKEVVKQIDTSGESLKLDDIEAERKNRDLPPEQNAANLVLKIADQIPPQWNAWRQHDKWLVQTLNNQLPGPERIQELRTFQGPTASVRDLARTLRGYPKGRYQIQRPDSPFAISLPSVKLSSVVSLLEYDVHLAVIDGDSDRGIQAAHAILNVARSIADEPAFGGQNLRKFFRLRAATAALGVIATGAPRTGLEEIQLALTSEANEPLFLYGARGERAICHEMFEGLESGKIKFENLLSMRGNAETPLANPKVFKAYRPLLPGDHAECLRLFTAYIEAAKLPWHEQLEAVARVAIEKEASEGIQYPITQLFCADLEQSLDSFLRSRAELLVAATAIACERFWRQHQRWPRDLDEIPRTILPSIPSSPFDAQPLRYQILPDRISLTCFCTVRGDPNKLRADFRDEKAGPIEFRYPDTPGFGIGACVWNPDRRGLPSREAEKP